jgi:hypothetical protein
MTLKIKGRRSPGAPALTDEPLFHVLDFRGLAAERLLRQRRFKT